AAGAVASMASQGVAMAMGMQDQFSWSQVGLSALGAGVSAGVGAGMLGDPLANAPIGVRAAAGNALTQGVAVATGLQKRFSWTALAASGAATGVSGWMGDSLGWKSSAPVAGVGYGTLRGLVSGGIQSQLTGQRPNWSAIAAESFGSALGDQVVSGIQSQDRARQQRLVEAMEEQLTAAQQTSYGSRGVLVADGGKTRLVWREILSDAEPGYTVDGTALRPVSRPLQALAVEAVDIMGQPLNGRSNYTIGQGWSKVMSGDASLWDFLTYQTPDAAQRRAELNAQWAPSKLVQQLDMLSSSPVATTTYLSAIWRGAGQAGQDAALTFGYAGGNVLGALAGIRTDATRLGLLGASNPAGGYGLRGLEGPGVVLELGGRLSGPIDIRSKITIPSGLNNNRSPIVIDLFGGRASQIPGAINVDIVAEQGIRASALKLPIKSGIADQVISSNPYLPNGTGVMDWLPSAADALKPGGQLIINYTAKNKFGQLPSMEVLEGLSLRVVQNPGPLLPQFQNNVFRFTDGTKIPNHKVMSVVLEKTRQK
ncbi:hypothetical protein NK214_24650, partial [Chromobacterium sp. S0633]|uniref:hypothetical protein n=1 Tax=Chromobacterium sp. S0633 TaxID=2957805 RepID=UPI00209E3E76